MDTNYTVKNNMLPLPVELQIYIFTQLDIHELIKLYHTNQDIRRILNTRDALNQLYIKYNLKATSFDDFINLYKVYVYELLNNLAALYHPLYGFRWNNELYYEYDEAVKALQNGEKLYSKGILIISKDELNPSKFYLYLPNEDYKQLEQLATTIMPYNKIILINKRGVYGLTEPWYEESKVKEFPPLNTKPYIIVNEMYKKITIDAKLKKLPITIDDVLFASRALAGKYDVKDDNPSFTIYKNNDILILYY